MGRPNWALLLPGGRRRSVRSGHWDSIACVSNSPSGRRAFVPAFLVSCGRTSGHRLQSITWRVTRSLPLTGARSSDQLAEQLDSPPSSRIVVLAQQAGAHEGDKRQTREHRTHAVPEVPRAFVRGPRARQLARRRAWANAILRRSLEDGEKFTEDDLKVHRSA